MTIILRLQGLDEQAGTEDIRTFFESFHIPDGGVYIVGGRLREAFIAFTTEKDAQLAMRHTGSFLKGSKVTLHISSMSELEHKLKSLLKRKKAPQNKLTAERPEPHLDANVLPLNALPQGANIADLSPPTAWTLDPSDTANLPQPLCPNSSNVQSLDSNTAFILGICTVLQGLQSSHQRKTSVEDPRVCLPKADSTVVSDEKTPEQTLNSKPGYVRLFGLPPSTTKDTICRFFRELTVQEAIVNVQLGLGHCCLVKFANAQDACDALLFNKHMLGPFSVEVRGATEKMWAAALQECERALDGGERVTSKQSPLRDTANHKQKSVSALSLKRPRAKLPPRKSLKKPRPNDDSTTALSAAVEHTVMVQNIPKAMTKTELKELFGCPNISHKNVLHLLDKEGNRTDTAFLIFTCTEDYDYAINLSGCHVGSDAIKVSPITKMMMWEMMAKSRPRGLAHHLTNTRNKPKLKTDRVETPEEAPGLNPDLAAQLCLFVRNLPANVQKKQIKTFFSKYKLREDNIVLLLDSQGKATGEAVVQFKSQKLAALAQRLHGQHFQGAKVLLTRINVKQKEDILARNV